MADTFFNFDKNFIRLYNIFLSIWVFLFEIEILCLLTMSGAYVERANDIDLNHSPDHQAPDPDWRSNDYYNSDDEEVCHQLREDLNMDHGRTCTGPTVAY